MTHDNVLTIANKYLVHDIDSATHPGERLAIILEHLERNTKLPNELLEFLNHGCFVALYLLATREVTFADYLPLAREEQDARRGTDKKEAHRIRFLAESQEAERERQNFALRMRERAQEEQRYRAEEHRLRMEKQQARLNNPSYQAKIRERELRRKYGLQSFIDRDNYPNLMKLLHNLDNGARMPAEEFVWLSTQSDENYENYLTPEIWNRYHFLEATHLAAEFDQTGDPWHAVNASGHFRKCERPELANQLLRDIKISQIKDVKLQSALSTTYGGVRRDLRQLDEALELGLRAYELTPRDFRPCTLLGAVSYQQGNYEQGQIWYDKAVQLGFKESQVDSELKNIYRSLDQDKQVKMREHLLSVDQQRYNWANKWGC